MAIALTPEAKHTISLTGEAKYSPTWNDATNTWDAAVGTWDVPGLVLTPETKTVITLTAEARH